MFVIIGYVVILGCVFGVYAATGGNMHIVAHAAPHELATILGAAIGSFLVTNQMKTVTATAKCIPKLLGGSKHTKDRKSVV